MKNNKKLILLFFSILCLVIFCYQAIIFNLQDKIRHKEAEIEQLRFQLILQEQRYIEQKTSLQNSLNVEIGDATHSE